MMDHLNEKSLALSVQEDDEETFAPDQSRTIKDIVEIDCIQEENVIDDTQQCDHNIEYTTCTSLVMEDNFTLNLENFDNDNFSLLSNEDNTENNTIKVDTDADTVQGVNYKDKTTVTEIENDVDLASKLVTNTCCHSNMERHKNAQDGLNIEAIFTDEGTNIIEGDIGLPLIADDSTDTCTDDISDKNSNENQDMLLPIPFFDHIDDDTDCSDTDFHTDKQNVMSLIPNFGLLQFDGNETASNSGCEDFDVVELLKEIKSDLKRRNGDLGQTALFEEQHSSSSCKHENVGVKSRSSKKRKKQQLKLRKTQIPDKNTGNTRRKFAQSFQELQRTRIEFPDYNMDSKYTCPVCLEMYHLPNMCKPCCHVFCDPCLRRMTGQGYEGIPCPLCRTVISSCQLDKDFDEKLLLEYPDIYTARAMSERKTKFRHYRLPYTAPVPLGKRLMRHLIASRNIQSDTRWMSHDWFKFLLGCTVGMCISLLIMLFNHVKSVRDARDVNIVFLSALVGMSVTFLIFKHIKI